MKLFLTSTGLPNETRSYFLELLNKSPSETNVAFIPTGADPAEDKWFVTAARNELLEIGFQVEDIDLKDFENVGVNDDFNLIKVLSKFDVIYVNGGNTFYLLDWIRKTEFGEALKEFLSAGKIYIGASAGSLIVGPDIELAGWDGNWDENIVGIENTSGIGIVGFEISPHFEEKYLELLKTKSKNVDYPIIAINDTQAILVNEDKVSLVGVGEEIILNNKDKKLLS